MLTAAVMAGQIVQQMTLLLLQLILEFHQLLAKLLLMLHLVTR
jgi:hypothetical protein